MTRRALFYGGLMLLLSACTPSTDKPQNATQEKLTSEGASPKIDEPPNATQEKLTSEGASPKIDEPQNATQEKLTSHRASLPIVLREVPLPPELADEITEGIAFRWSLLNDKAQKEGGVAIGVVIDDAVVYTSFWGTTHKDGADITRQTMFNVHPANPFKLSSESGMFTAEGFKKAGITDIAFEPDESFAHPHMFSYRTPDDENRIGKMLSFEETKTKGDLWTNLDGAMRYLASHQPVEGLTKINMNNFEEEVLDRVVYGNGFTVSVTSVPSQKMYIVILENSIDKGIDCYETSVLEKLVPHNMKPDTRIEEMSPDRRQIYYALGKDDKKLVGQYQCDEGYRNFEIVRDENKDEFILITDRWRSRIAGVDTYETSNASVNEDGELIIDGAEVAYRLLDAPAANLILTPVFDDSKNIQSLTVGDIWNEYERIESTIYHYKTINSITTCKPVRE